MREAALHPTRQAVFLGAGDLQEPPGHRYHLDRIERGDHPLQHLCLSGGIGGHQHFALAGQMQQAGAALEQVDLAVAQEGHLAEGLAREMRWPSVLQRDRPHGIAQPGLLAGLSEAQVAHEAARAIGHPVVGRENQACHVFTPAAPSYSS